MITYNNLWNVMKKQGISQYALSTIMESVLRKSHA